RAPLGLPSFPTRRSSDLSPASQICRLSQVCGAPLVRRPSSQRLSSLVWRLGGAGGNRLSRHARRVVIGPAGTQRLFSRQNPRDLDRKSTRLNSSHQIISY